MVFCNFHDVRRHIPSGSEAAGLKLVALAAAFIVFVGNGGSSLAASSQELRGSSDRTHVIAVFGDSLARELWNGMRSAFRRNGRVKVLRYAKSATGLVRNDRYDWLSTVRHVSARHRINTAVILIGGNDRQTMRTRSGTYRKLSDQWIEEYARRIDQLTRTLMQRGTRVYWVGIPIVRSGRMARDFKRFNRIYQARARANGAYFIDTWNDFKSDDGGYTPFGRTLGGRYRKLRDDDGLHFTLAGAYVFGDLIARRISRHSSTIGAQLSLR